MIQYFGTFLFALLSIYFIKGTCSTRTKVQNDLQDAQNFTENPAETEYLSSYDIEHFKQKGWCVIKNFLKPEFCEAYVKNYLEPKMEKIKFDKNDKNTWGKGEKRKQAFQPNGVMLDLDCECPEFFQNEKLKNIMDCLHGGDHWSPFTDKKMGYAHIRYPWGQCNPKKYNAKSYGHPLFGWHIDGNDGSYWHLQEKKISIILMPIFSGPTFRHGGITTLLSGSHFHVAKLYQNQDADGICFSGKGTTYWQKMRFAHKMASCCFRPKNVIKEEPIAKGEQLNPGDMLIMHGMLAHCASANYSKICRIAFTLRPEWKTDLDLEKIKNEVEKNGADSVAPILFPIAKLYENNKKK